MSRPVVGRICQSHFIGSEENNFTVDEVLVGQYLRNKRIAREFSSYYDLYQKYKKDYRVAQILAGNADADVRKRAKIRL